ncbi:MAG: hypothetical protein JW763_10740 [candidate division Zixibacteria bacterium]|nr:hypothetical protein [candidate division Zixibacteria bacterium]
MMSCKLAFILSVLFLTGITAVAVDTLHVTAELDTLRKQVVGVMTYRLPDTPEIATFEFQLVPNMYAERNTPYLKSKPQLLNIFESTNEWGGMTIDSALLDGDNSTERVTVEYTKGGFQPQDKNRLNGRTVRLYFTTRIPRLGDRLSYFGEDYLLDGWFPFPALLRDDGSWYNPDYNANAELVGPFMHYDIHIAVPSGMIVAAPVPPESGDKQGETTCYRYHFGPAHDFGLAMSPYYLIDSTRLGNATLLYYYHAEEQPILPEIKTAAESTYVYMNKTVGENAYGRLGFVLTPTAIGGGIEFPGLISLYSPRGGAMLSRMYELVVVHETIHQWFYAMVASDQVREPWLDESVTNFWTDRVFSHLWGEEDGLLDLAGLSLSSRDYLRLTAQTPGGAGRLNRPAESLVSSADFFSVIYSHGALALETFDNLLGDSLSGIFWREYVARNTFRHVTADDFVTLAEEISGSDIHKALLCLLNDAEALDYRVTELTNTRVDSVAEIGFTLSRTGKLDIAIPYWIILYNNDTLRYEWKPEYRAERITITAPSPAREIIIDPEHLVAVDIDLINNSVLAAADNRPGLRLSSGVMFLVESLLSVVGGW